MKGGVDEMDKIDIMLMIAVITMILVGGIGLLIHGYEEYWIKPIASERANEICQEQGFDFYEGYDRIGILSKEPVAIICKYVEQYRIIDLNMNKGSIEISGE